ncbi:MAG: hypothetical protein AAF696_06910 [Bacteroidota bacterium]
MNDIVKYGLGLLLYLFFQVFLFNELELFGLAVPHVFVLFLLLLPFRLPRPAVYLIAFFLGFLVDILTDGAVTGLQAFSCVLMVGLRGGIASILSSSNFRNLEDLEFNAQNGIWYLGYLLPLIFVHQLSVYFMEALSLQNFLYKMGQIGLGTVFTFLICYILVVVFYKR